MINIHFNNFKLFWSILVAPASSDSSSITSSKEWEIVFRTKLSTLTKCYISQIYDFFKNFYCLHLRVQNFITQQLECCSGLILIFVISFGVSYIGLILLLFLLRHGWQLRSEMPNVVVLHLRAVLPRIISDWTSITNSLNQENFLLVILVIGKHCWLVCLIWYFLKDSLYDEARLANPSSSLLESSSKSDA